jgi:hypothetical protein
MIAKLHSLGHESRQINHVKFCQDVAVTQTAASPRGCPEIMRCIRLGSTGWGFDHQHIAELRDSAAPATMRGKADVTGDFLRPRAKL